MNKQFAIIEYKDGSREHHTNVKSAGIRSSRKGSVVKVVYNCGTEVLYPNGISVAVGMEKVV